MPRLRLISLLWIAATVTHAAETLTPPARFAIEDSLAVSTVPADFPVQFALLTTPPLQYVAYYDADRRMTVAARSLDSTEWKHEVLPSRIEWDSHNYITMAEDAAGHLHVAGNMHNVPLIYFRTTVPGDIATLAPAAMTGEWENSVTYPGFLTNAEGKLIFHYRNGGSGNGMRLYNQYDSTSQTWTRLLDQPLLNGEGERNAYPLGPRRGPEGWFHLVWVWRDTPDCATNHHLSHARSRDLVHWESVFGEPVELPLTLDKEALWVDPIPSGGGIINGCEKLAFDAQGRPIISYHKSDEDGNMQIYAARPEGGVWKVHRLTEWNEPIPFSGYGSMGFIGIEISEMRRLQPGLLTMTYRHRDHGRGRLFIDEVTLHPVEPTITVPPDYPVSMEQVQSDFGGMQIQRVQDSGSSGDATTQYLLQWETLGRLRDRPRQPPLPDPSVLKVMKLVEQE